MKLATDWKTTASDDIVTTMTRTQDHSLTVQWIATRRLIVTPGIGYRGRAYSRSTDDPAARADREEQRLIWQLGSSFSLRDNITIKADYQFQNQRSIERSGEYSSHMGNIGMAIIF